MKLPKIDIKIPYRLHNAANKYEFHFKRSKRIREEKAYLTILLKPQIRNMKPPVRITLTRIAPRSLDDEDNFRMAFKSFKDIIASLFFPDLKPGRADGLDCFEWHFMQEKGVTKEYAVRILIEEKTDDPMQEKKHE